MGMRRLALFFIPCQPQLGFGQFDNTEIKIPIEEGAAVELGAD
jgi:hypothetical protein